MVRSPRAGYAVLVCRALDASARRFVTEPAERGRLTTRVRQGTRDLITPWEND